MRTKLATYALAGTLGLTGVAGATLLAPALSYAATGDSTALTDRVSHIKEALAGLVSDGTITQAQADKVATVIAESAPDRGPGGPGGPGRHGHGPDLAAAATALNLTEDELRSQLQAGKTLADVADAQGVAQADLVKALVTAEKARLAEAVSSGRLTQARADEIAANLEQRITEHLDDVCPPGGPRGPRGEAPAAPDEQPSTSSSSTSSTA